MSAMVLGPPGVVLLTKPAAAAADLKWSITQVQGQSTDQVSTKAKALLSALVECANLTWEFNVRVLKDEEDDGALRTELITTLDYVRIGRLISSGNAGQDAVNLVRGFDPALANRLMRAREDADKPLRELEIATRFLLEDNDPDGEIEEEFGLLTPSDSARGETTVELDFN